MSLQTIIYAQLKEHTRMKGYLGHLDPKPCLFVASKVTAVAIPSTVGSSRFGQRVGQPKEGNKTTRAAAKQVVITRVAVAAELTDYQRKHSKKLVTSAVAKTDLVAAK